MEAVISNFDEYLAAFGLTIGLFVVSGIASLVLGTILAVLRVGPISILNKAAALYVTLFRNTPLLMIFIFMAVAMPVLGYNFKFVENIEIAGYNVSAFFFRACLALVPLGQAEAGRAIGLTFSQSMQLVILPQATRAVIPPMTSVLIALAKNTSVAAAFGIAEATATMRAFTNDYADQRIGIFLAFAIGYIVIVEVISLSSYFVERKVRVAR